MMAKDLKRKLLGKCIRCILAFLALMVLPIVTVSFIAENVGHVYPITRFAIDANQSPRMTRAILLVYTSIFGACIGSFANVLIYRVPKNISVIKGGSICPHCKKRIRLYDLIPICSYIVLGGKCRYCKTALSIHYPMVEWLSCCLAVVSVWAYGLSAAALTSFFIFIVLLCISFIDMQYMIIPNGLVLVLAVLSTAYAVFCGDASGVSLLNRVAGFFILSVPMLGLTILIRDAFGGGDIKLIAVCGFLLGLEATLLTGFLAVMMGGFTAIYIKYIKKDVDTIHIPFGQYICMGAFLSMLFGGEMAKRYFALFL